MEPEARRGPAAARLRPEERARIGRIARLWAELVLGAIVLLSSLALWHLVRRGRLLRARLASPRPIPPLPLPRDDDGPASERSSTDDGRAG